MIYSVLDLAHVGRVSLSCCQDNLTSVYFKYMFDGSECWDALSLPMLQNAKQCELQKHTQLRHVFS